ncbi:hypothetical protein Dsin_018095 [Dipteronia sinensis]|uniref:FAS1 domain-containing protein n=1 Tax=Dipteronia sinensis TaxID=43782 RepID=A0AAE0AGJ0_9ROSI|nr:hypothetical protein Dsin_018095 [Dipteronia sinensis]
MNPKTPFSLLALVALVFVFSSSSSVNALNILQQLKGYDNYGAFVDLLNQTKLYQKINERNTVTILALTNATIASIQGRSDDEKVAIISSHVLLDYFDKIKLNKISKSVAITTLYQSSGVANDEQGFVNITRLSSGEILFGSAMKKAPLVARLEKEVFTKPYNLSVLQVSLPIIAPGIGEAILPPPPPPFTPPPSESPNNDDEEEESGEEEESSDSPAEAPADSPESGSPAPSPVADADAPGPATENEEDTPADTTSGSGASRVLVGAATAVMALVFNFL